MEKWIKEITKEINETNDIMLRRIELQNEMNQAVITMEEYMAHREVLLYTGGEPCCL